MALQIAKTHYLRKPADFKRVFEEGRAWANRAVVARTVSNNLEEVRIGIVVSRKLGNAVVRNRIRRIFREACRHLPGTLCGGVDIVLVARGAAKSLTMWEAAGRIAEILVEAGVLKTSKENGGDCDRA